MDHGSEACQRHVNHASIELDSIGSARQDIGLRWESVKTRCKDISMVQSSATDKDTLGETFCSCVNDSDMLGQKLFCQPGPHSGY